MFKMSKYSNWSKEALISKILSLESSKSGHKNLNIRADRMPSPASDSEESSASSETQLSNRKNKQMDFSKFATRRVAIRFAYLGWNYHGLAYQKEGHRTVESEILHALYKTKCIPSLDPYQCNFSRCGRTDADVSAMAQVISLDLRSMVPAEQQSNPEMDCQELDYLKILNSHLPADILAYQVCLRPLPDFDARFSCTSRHYHYYFNGYDLDIAAMRDAASRIVGEHDFRNFCKIDGSKQITNFRRLILESKIERQVGGGDDGLYYLSLRGKAFLWNQVRSIMAILLLVGQRLEPPSIIDKLLDIEATPRRPAYEIAWGVPLVLVNCEFPPMDWSTSHYTSIEPLENVWHRLALKQGVAKTMMGTVRQFCAPIRPEDVKCRVNVGQGLGKRSKRYTKLYDRPVSEAPEIVNKKWLERKQQREVESSKKESNNTLHNNNNNNNNE